jgi:hypothetical protein
MPEAFIIYRRKYDKELRDRLSERYTNHYVDECDLVSEWWSKFNALNEKQLAMVKEIVSKNRFTVEDCNVFDESVKEVLGYYQIRRDSNT